MDLKIGKKEFKLNLFPFPCKYDFSQFLNKNLFTDAILISSDYKLFPVHKIILASCSDYFNSLFKDNLNNNNLNYEGNVKLISDFNCKNRYFDDSNQTDQFIDNEQWKNLEQLSFDAHRFNESSFLSKPNDEVKKRKDKLKFFSTKFKIQKKSVNSNLDQMNLNNLFIESNSSIQNSKFKVFFPDINSKILKIILDLLYTGNFDEINHSNLFDVILALDRLCMNEMLRILCHFLVETIKIDNCIGKSTFN